jgi:hypothetical protein
MQKLSPSKDQTKTGCHGHNRWFRNLPKHIVSLASLLLLAFSTDLSPILFAQLPQAPTSSGMSSKDYLRLMEQANEHNGVQAVGGNYPGARPRPVGSLPTTPTATLPTPPPAKQPTLSPTTKTKNYPRAILRSSPISTDATSTDPISTDAVSVPLQTTPPETPVATQWPTSQLPTTQQPDPQWQSVQLPTSQNPTPQYPLPYGNLPPTGIPNPTVPAAPISAMPSKPFVPSTSYNFDTFDGPRWLVRYAPVWVHRSGDENLTYSQSGVLSPFGSDTAHEIAVGKMTNPMDAYEFSFMGSLNWNRSETESASTASSPLNTSLVSPDPNWLTNFQNATHLHQVQSADYRSFGFHKRWLTDEINNYRVGFQGIEYNEAFALRSEGPQGTGRFENQTQNWLLGFSGGFEHWHPVAEKLSIGGTLDSGLFLNLAESSISAANGNAQQVQLDTKETSCSALFGANVRTRYQLSDRWNLHGGYRWWVLTGIATVDDQNIRDLHNTMSLSLSSDETILFHGADACIEYSF